MLFVAVFPGMFVGGVAVIVAKDQKAAKRKLRRKLNKGGLKLVKGKEIKWQPVEQESEGVIYFDNGDY